MSSCVYDAGADDQDCEFVRWQAEKELQEIYDKFDKVDRKAIIEIEKRRDHKLKELGCYD
jgi:hypothetical protein